MNRELLILSVLFLSLFPGCQTVSVPRAPISKQDITVISKEEQPAETKDGGKVSLPHEKLVLPNGLIVILAKDNASPFVAVNVWYNVGAINEQRHRTGLAHLFEHLMFEGTRHIKQDGYFKLLENAGAFDLNASTNFDRTNFYQTMPKNELELALALESSRMFWLTIDQARLDEQRAVVRREREQRLEVTPYGMAAHKLWQSMFKENHPFHGQVIGSHEDLERATLEDVQRFYDRFYGPTNATLTLVGDFDRDHALNLITKYFGSLPKTEVVTAPVLPQLVLNDEEILREEEKLGKLTLVHYQYATPGLYTKGDAEMDVLAHILTGGAYGRLTKAITRDKQMASSVSAFQQSFGQTSVFTIDAVLLPGVDENSVIKEIDTVLKALAEKPIEANEIERARNSILTQQLFSLQSLGGFSGRAELLQNYNRYGIELADDIMRYRSIDEAILKESAKNHLSVGKGRKILVAKPAQISVVKKGN